MRWSKKLQMSLFVWGHWHFPSLTLMGNRPTFVCQQSAQKTFLQMLFYVLLLICLCCILACCLFCSADGIQLREKNKTCVMPSQHPIRHAADITSHVQLFLLLGRVECWPNVSNGLHIPSIKSDRFWHCRLSLASIYSLGRWDKTQFSTLCEKCLCTRQYEFIICILLTFPLFSGKRRRWWTFLPASWSAWRAEEGRCVKPLNCDFSLFLSHFFVCFVNVWCCVCSRQGRGEQKGLPVGRQWGKEKRRE